MIARLLTGDEGKLCFADFNSFLKANRTLYACLDRTLWQEAAESESATERVFMHLIRTNDLSRLKFFLELGADVDIHLTEFADDKIRRPRLENFERNDTCTPLQATAHLDNVPMARLLLEHGADVVQYENYDRPSYSAIHAARSAEMVELLLEYGADPEQELFIVGCRPLHYYAWGAFIGAMRVVLQHGVELCPLSGSLTPPPIICAVWSNIEAVKLLLEYGADMKMRAYGGDTPLLSAVRARETDMAKLFLELWPDGARETDYCGRTPLHLAAMKGNADMVRSLLEIWPEGMKEKDGDGNTPLHLAAKKGNTDMVRSLLEIWPEGTKEKDEDGNTPLHYASAHGGIDMVRLLLECWPDGTREKNNFGNTPLHLAVAENMADAVRLLMESWPEGKEALNEGGHTPLSWFFKWHAHHDLDGGREIIALLGGATDINND